MWVDLAKMNKKMLRLDLAFVGVFRASLVFFLQSCFCQCGQASLGRGGASQVKNKDPEP